MKSMHLYSTVLLTFLFLTACGAKSTGNSAASTVPLGSGHQQSSLVASSSAQSIVPGSTTTFSVVGGVAPYTWAVTSGGGTLSSNTGASVIYTASNSAGLTYVTVSDSAGNSTTAAVNVVSSTPTPAADGKVCQGNYAVTLGTYQAAAQFATTGTALTGILLYAGHQYPLQGTCNGAGVSFTLTETGDTFTGTFAANPSGAARAAISGTYLNAYYKSTQTWTATPQ